MKLIKLLLIPVFAYVAMFTEAEAQIQAHAQTTAQNANTKTQLAHGITRLTSNSEGGTVKNRHPFTVYFVEEIKLRGKKTLVAGIQHNYHSGIEQPFDPEEIKILDAKDIEAINDFLYAGFRPGPDGYDIINTKEFCGANKHEVQSISAFGPRNPGSNGVGCFAIGGVSDKFLNYLKTIENAVEDEKHVSLRRFNEMHLSQQNK